MTTTPSSRLWFLCWRKVKSKVWSIKVSERSNWCCVIIIILSLYLFWIESAQCKYVFLCRKELLPAEKGYANVQCYCASSSSSKCVETKWNIWVFDSMLTSLQSSSWHVATTCGSVQRCDAVGWAAYRVTCTCVRWTKREPLIQKTAAPPESKLHGEAWRVRKLDSTEAALK